MAKITLATCLKSSAQNIEASQPCLEWRVQEVLEFLQWGDASQMRLNFQTKEKKNCSKILSTEAIQSLIWMD